MQKKVILLFTILIFAIPCLAQENQVAAMSDSAISKVEITPPQWGPYMQAVMKKIQSNWELPSETEYKKVVCMFSVKKDGSVSNIHITQSGSAEEDDAAIQAIKKAAPFEPLPDEFPGGLLNIDFTFDYSILNSIPQRPISKQAYFPRKTKDKILKNPDYTVERSYVIQARQKILKNWKPKQYLTYSKTKTANNIVCNLTINKKGDITDYKIVDSAHYKEAEKRVQEAIEKSTPFEVFPNEIEKDLIRFNIRFIY